MNKYLKGCLQPVRDWSGAKRVKPKSQDRSLNQDRSKL